MRTAVRTMSRSAVGSTTTSSEIAEQVVHLAGSLPPGSGGGPGGRSGGGRGELLELGRRAPGSPVPAPGAAERRRGSASTSSRCVDEPDPLHAELGPAAPKVQVRHREVDVDGARAAPRAPGGRHRGPRRSGPARRSRWPPRGRPPRRVPARLRRAPDAPSATCSSSSRRSSVGRAPRAPAGSLHGLQLGAAPGQRAGRARVGRRPPGRRPCRAWRRRRWGRVAGPRRRPRWPPGAGASGGTRSRWRRTAAAAQPARRPASS